MGRRAVGGSARLAGVAVGVGFPARLLYASSMRYVKVIDAARRVAVADRVGVAETPSSRRRGLLGTDALAEGEGLLLVPCRQVHTFGMRYPVDVVFLDGSHRVVRVAGSLKPWRLSPVVWRARAVLELPAGRTERTGITEGNLLEVISLPER